MKGELERYLKPGAGLDFGAPDLRAFARKHTQWRTSVREKAVALYYAVRDGWRYNPYNISLRPEDLRASRILERPEGHCLDKGILLTAALRAVGIPARLCLSKVKNHIAAERMIELFGTDELVPHGYVELWIAEKWLKVTPAFNRELCEFLGVAPLEFDGYSDALFQAYDREGKLFMEYLEDYGHFEDVPFGRIRALLQAHYPHVFSAERDRLDRESMMQLRPGQTNQIK